MKLDAKQALVQDGRLKPQRFDDGPRLRVGGIVRELLQLMQFVAMSGTFVLVFLSYAWMLNAEDVLELIGIKKKAAAT